MIRHLLSATLFLALCSTTNAQQYNLGKAYMASPEMESKVVSNSTNSVTIDTLKPASIKTGGCAVTGTMKGLVYYGINRRVSNDSGYYFGTGKFPQAGVTLTASAQKYSVGTKAATVTNVLVLAARAHGTTATTTAQIYAQNASTKGPGTSLGTSTALPMSSWSTTNYTCFTFATAAAVPAGSVFFASVSNPAFGGADLDTLALLDTQLGCYTTDTTAWVQLNSTTTWSSVKAAFGNNLDLMIFPVLDITTGIDNYVSKDGLNLYAASPNPANNSINLNFSLNNPSKIEIEVYDLSGKVVKAIPATDNFNIGKNTINLELSSFASGTYFYAVNANGNKMFSKFVVIK